MTSISVILVTGDAELHGRSAELLYTNGSRVCRLPNLPSYRSEHSQTGVTLCGGYIGKTRTTCHTLNSTGSWELSHNLDKRRWLHSAWASPQGIMLLGGGYSRKTTEILLDNGDTIPGFRLGYETRYFCM